MTCLGINNVGELVFDYYHEDHDTDGDKYVYNGAESALWVNFRESFADEIQELYSEWRKHEGKPEDLVSYDSVQSLLSYEKIIEYFVTRQSDKWSISVYNEDADFKYISMLRSENNARYLFQVRGTGEEHLKYFAKNRLMYCDSKWNAGYYPDDRIILRLYTPDGDLAVAPNHNITVTPFSNIYAGVKYNANGTLQQQRAEKNVPVTFNPSADSEFGDTDTYIYGASEMSSIGDLSPMYCGYVDVSKATKLTELIIGSNIEGYTNTNLKTVAVGTNKLLKKINVCNCPSLTDPLVLSNCPNIQEIYATGSGITGVELPKSGYLKKVYLPATLTNLTVTNQQYIEAFELEGYNNLTTLRIEDTVGIPVEDIMLNAPNLNRIRLIDVRWEAESEEALVQTVEKFKSCLGLDANGNNTDKAVVTGRVHVAEKVSDEVFGDIYNSFPDLVVDDGSEEIYIINYKDRDGKILYSTRVSEGASAIDPIEKGYIETPEAIITDTYRYEFVGWSTLPTNINRHYIITAQYHTKFAIKFYNEGNLIYTQWSVQGDAAEDPVANGSISAPIKTGTADKSYKFSKWDNLPTNVQSSTSVHALFDTYWAARFWNDKIVYLTEWVIDGGTVVAPKNYFENYTNPTRESTAQYDYTFAQWDGDFDTPMTAAREFYATYYNTVRRYNVYFYNDNELLYTVENVPYGGSTSYVGATPIKLGVEDPSEYVFKGWLPAPTEITGETKCYALFKFTGYLFGKLNEDSEYGTVDAPNWDKINAYWDVINTDVIAYNNGVMSEEDFKAKYMIGGRMLVPLEVQMIENLSSITYEYKSGVYTPVDMEIIAYNHDNLSSGNGKATLTFFCKDLPNLKQKMNTDSTNIGGYEASYMRQFVNTTLFEKIPGKLKDIIKPVYKISDGGATNATLVTTIDYMWLASCDELYMYPGNCLTEQGEPYLSVFNDKESRKKYITDNTEAGGYWTRTAYYSPTSSSMFWRVTNSGGSYSDIAFNNFYVAFGFCI